MNNQGYYILRLLIIVNLVILSGCKDFLSLHPMDTENVDNSFQTSQDINLGVMGVYDALQGGNYPQHMAMLTELLTDNAYTQARRLSVAGAANLREFANFQLTNENGTMEGRWNRLYNGISRANLILEKIDEVTFAERTVKDQYTGEVKFLRAVFYFDLLRFFGGVPVSLSPITSPGEAFALRRESEERVFEVIINDLQQAIELLPLSYNNANLGRATEGAAKALLAKVYLTNNQPELALPLLRELTNAPYNYDLMNTYAQVFDTDNTRESIFEIQYTTNGENQGNPYPNWFLPDGSTGPDIFGSNYAGGNGQGISMPTDDLYDSYEDNDPRRDYTIAEYFSVMEQANIYRVNKYRGAPTAPNTSEDNLILLRYADVLLMLAEAINETGGPTGEAYDAVDEVRIRANLAPWERNLNYDSFKTQLLQERRHEFAFENHRWFDLKRFGKTVEILSGKGYPIQSHHLLFPIPRSETEINPNLIQNPGY